MNQYSVAYRVFAIVEGEKVLSIRGMLGIFGSKNSALEYYPLALRDHPLALIIEMTLSRE